MQFLEQTMENVRKNRDINLVKMIKRRTIWCQNQIVILQNFSQEV